MALSVPCATVTISRLYSRVTATPARYMTAMPASARSSPVNTGSGETSSAAICSSIKACKNSEPAAPATALIRMHTTTSNKRPRYAFI